MRKIAILVTIIALTLPALTGCSGVPIVPKSDVAPVLVVVTPPVTWADVTSGEMPVLLRLSKDSAIGLVASRDPAESLATLSVYDATSRDVATVQAEGSLAEIDLAAAEAVSHAPAGTAIVVVSVPGEATPGHGGSAGVVMVSGAGFGPGLLTSASTRRDGLVTDVDLSATVEHIAGPVAETKAVTLAVIDDGKTPGERVEWLERMAVFLDAIELIRVPIFYTYTTFMLILLLCGWFVAERFRDAAKYGYWSLVLRRFILFGLVLPVGGTLLFIADRFPDSPQRIVALLLAASGFLWIFGEFAWHKWGTAGAIAFAGIAAGLVLGADQLTGATLSLSSVFSYSPLAGFRYFGIGNEGAAILIGGALVGVALELDAVGASERLRRSSIAGAGALAVVACAAPFFGANVIVALWGTVTFAVFYLAAERRRARATDVVAIVLISVGALGAMVLLDRFSGGTHIGQAASDAASGGLLPMLVGRLETSLRIFTDSALPAVVLAIAAVIGYLYVRPRGRMAEVLGKYPVFSAAVLAGLTGGLVGAALEDSGVVVLALIITYLLGGLVALMLEPDRGAAS